MTTTTATLTARPIETRLRPLYAAGFIHGFALRYSVEKLFMRSIGPIVVNWQ